MDIQYLREATAEDHERVESSLPLMSPTLTRATYTWTLRRLFGFVTGWEQAALQRSPAALVPLIQARSRSDLLEQDLMELSCAPGALWGAEGLEWDAAGLLGSMYVLEGSRLGGQLIARHVEALLGLPLGRGTAYFRGFGADTGAMWREFASVVDREIPPADADRAIAAARMMFRSVETWMRGDAPFSPDSAELTREGSSRKRSGDEAAGSKAAGSENFGDEKSGNEQSVSQRSESQRFESEERFG